MSHEGAVLDVFIVTDDMHGIIAGLGWPVMDIAGAITFIVTLDFRL